MRKENIICFLCFVLSVWTPVCGQTGGPADEANYDDGGLDPQTINLLAGAFPEMAADIIRNVSTDIIPVLVSAISPPNLLNVTAHLDYLDRIRVMGALNASQIIDLIDRMDPEQRAQLLDLLPPDGVVALSRSLSAEQLSHVLMSLPAESVVELTGRLNKTQNAEVLGRLTAAGVLQLISMLNQTQVLQVLDHLPPWEILNVTSSLTSQQLSALVGLLGPEAVLRLVLSLPPAGVEQLLSDLPSDALRNLTLSFKPDQLPLLLSRIPPQKIPTVTAALTADELSSLLTSLPLENLLNMTVSLGLPRLISLLKTLPPSAVKVLISRLPAEALVDLVMSLSANMSGDLMDRWPSEVVASVLQALPVNVTLQLLGNLSNDTLAAIATRLTVPQLLAILSPLPPEAVKSLLATLPTSVLPRVLSAASEDQVSQLLGLIPNNYISTVLASIDPNLLTSLALTLSPASLSRVLLALDPSQLSWLLDRLPADITAALLPRLPSTLLVNLTALLPLDQLTSVLSSLDSTLMSALLAAFPPQALSELVERLQRHPAALLNLTLSLSPDTLASLLTSLPASLVGGLVDALLPQPPLNDLINRLPADMLLNLTSHMAFETLARVPVGTLLQVIVSVPHQQLLGLIQQIFPAGPLSLLALIPEDILQQIVGSVTAEQIQTLLGIFPPGAIEHLLENFLDSALKKEGSSTDLTSVLTPAVTALAHVLQGMNATQLTRLTSRLTVALRSALPVLQQALANVSASGIGGSGLGGLVTSLVTSVVPMSSLIKLAGQMLPQLPRLLASSVGEVGTAVAQKMNGEAAAGLTDCVVDLQMYLMDLSDGQDWAVRMFDASGKPSRGILKGNIHMHGSYDMCLDIHHIIPPPPPNTSTPVLTNLIPKHIRGGYCGAQIDLPPGMLPPIPGQGILPDVQIELYLCLPQSCRASQLSSLLSAVSLPLNITVPTVNCQEEGTLYRDGAAIATICVLCLLGMLVLLGTVLDLFCNKNSDDSGDDDSLKSFSLPTFVNGGFNTKEEEGGVMTEDVGGGEKQTSFITIKNSNNSNSGVSEDGVGKEKKKEGGEGVIVSLVLRAFSLPRNTERILGVHDVTGSVTCLHGIRVLSMMWLILGNAVLYWSPYYENSLGAAEVLETFVGQVIIQSSLAVDSFFLISGCLTSLLFVRKVKEEGGVKGRSVLAYFLRRYVRLTPSYAVVLMVLTCLLPYMSDGPEWTQQATEYYRPCQQYWWTNLLYINNFYSSIQQQCVPWGWYLAADLQFHWLLAPVILLPFALGYNVVVPIFMAALVVMQPILIYYFNIDINGDTLRNREQFWWQVMEKPYTRLAPFVVGMGVGFVLSRVKGRLNIHKVAVGVGWVLSLALMVACVFVKYDDNHVLLEQSFHWSQMARVWHETLYRVLFSLALGWLLLMCATGHGGMVNSLLSWKVWLPGSRLTYCVYLLHPAIILADVWHSRVGPYFTISFLVLRASGYIMISAFFAYCLSVIVETPIAALEAIVLRKSRRQRDQH